jgi:hypothetical protein
VEKKREEREEKRRKREGSINTQVLYIVLCMYYIPIHTHTHIHKKQQCIRE